jgi:DNA-binding NarL/FixJ family response regulator
MRSLTSRLRAFALALPIRVMIVDDHDVVRSGLRTLLEASGEIVVAEAGSHAEAVREATRTNPQVIVMDVRLGSESGIAATAEILAMIPDARVLMLTSFHDEDALAAAMLAGARGFVLKDVTGDAIVEGVRAVAHGERAFDPNLLSGDTFTRIGDRIRAMGHRRPDHEGG